MQRFLWVTLLVGLSITWLSGQTPERNEKDVHGTEIALIDMAEVFEKSKRFEVLRAELRDAIIRVAQEGGISDAESKRRLLVMESNLYQQTYSEIRVVVEALAVKQNIAIVVRYSRKKLPVEGLPHKSLPHMKNKFVVYSDTKLDITDEVVKRLNAAYERDLRIKDIQL